jgi:tRNA1Val (adenine37-N6)-methyltransferase
MKVGTDSMLLGALLDCENANNILDIGTGTGVLALMMAQRSQAHIDAVEIVPDAAEQARYNIEASRWANRIKVFNCSIQEYDSEGKKYDLILSNPPYFPPHQAKAMNENRFKARASASLDFKGLIENSAKLLSPNGTFAVIIPYAEKWNFMALCEKNNLYPTKEIAIYSYSFASPVRCILQFSRFNEIPFQQKSFSIYDAKRKYTEEYISATKDFHAIDLSRINSLKEITKT